MDVVQPPAPRSQVPTGQIVTRPRLASAWLNPFATLGCCLVLLVIVHRATAAVMLKDWRRDPFEHGYLVVAAAAYLAWTRRERLASLSPRPSFFALSLLGLASLAWLLSSLTATESVQQLCLLTMFIGFIWAVLGSAAVRTLRFPLGILVFALPVGDRLAPALQELTARAAVKMLTSSGVHAVLTGEVISIADERWRVAAACGGINYLVASVAVGYLYAGTAYRQWRHRLAFLLGAVVVPLVGNALRVYTTILLDHLGATAVVSGMNHELFGVFVFVTMLAVLFATCGHWHEDPPPVPEPWPRPAQPPRATASASGARVLLCATAGLLVVISAPVSAKMILAESERRAGRQNLATVASPWTVVSGDDLEWPPGRGAAHSGVLRTYRYRGQVVRLYVVSHNATQPGLSPASIILEGTPWSAAAERHRRILVEGQPLQVRESIVRSPQVSLLVWTWYAIDGSYTANYYVGKVLLARATLRRHGGLYATIAIATEVQPGVDPADTLVRFVGGLSLRPDGHGPAAEP
jgi:exosortase A